MNRPSPARVIAVCLGLAGFAIAIIAGLAHGAEAQVILSHAVVSLFVSYLVGYAAGLAGQRAVEEAAASYCAQHSLDAAPVKEDHDSSNDPGPQPASSSRIEAPT